MDKNALVKTPPFEIYPVGIIKKSGNSTCVHIYEPFKDALRGLDGFSHILVFYWFHQNDTPEKRGILQVHPKKNKQNPLTGVFATHSPVRPNLIAMSPCKLLRIDHLSIEIDEIDARDGSPVIDLKPHIPDDKLEKAEIKVPAFISAHRDNLD